MATEEEDTECCILEEGKRCKQEASGQPFAFTKRLQRSAWGKHKLEQDEKANHTRLCAHHRGIFTAMKRQIDNKRKKVAIAEDDGVITVCQ